MKLKLLFLLFTFAFLLSHSSAQNVGIGIDTPQAKLHVNGSFRLKNGVAVNSISADSSFNPGNDSTLPTQKAIKRYLQKGSWFSSTDSVSNPVLIFKDSVDDNNSSPSPVIISGNYAYAVFHPSGGGFLRIYDISNPGNIVVKDSINGNIGGAVAMAKEGNYVYIIVGNSLKIFDVGDPNNIVAKSSISLPGSSLSIDVQGNYAYATGGSNWLNVYDVSNPNNIVLLGSTTAGLNFPTSVYARGSYVYLTTGPFGNSKLCIYDVSVPGTFTLKSASPITYSIGMKIQDNYAYSITADDSLYIYDISDPNNVVTKGSTNSNIDGALKLAVNGKYAFVSNSNSTNRVCMFDISDPDHIVFKTSTTQNLTYPNELASDGNYLFVGSLHRLSSFFYGKTGTLSLNDAGEVAFLPNQWDNGSANNIFRSNGNVGIGTASPSQRLSVAGGITVDAEGVNDGTASNMLRFGGDSHQSGIASCITPTGNQLGLDFYTAGVNRMAISYGGGIGIGTLLPANMLDVVGSVAIGTGYAGSQTAPTDGLLVKGSVGIGMLPAGKLDVNGNANILGDTYVSGNMGIGVTLPSQKLSVAGGVAIDRDGVNTGSVTNSLRFGSETEGQAIASKRTAGGNQFGLDFYTNSSNRFSITNGGNIGIGIVTPLNKLDVEGAAVIGTNYSGTNTAPTNGLLVEGNVGIGVTTPQNKLDIEGGAVIGAAYSGTNAAPSNGLLIQGNTGIGVATPQNKLDVEGSVAIGATYSGTNAGPANGLIVEGRLGIGTPNPSVPLEVVGTSNYNVGTYQYINQSGSGFFSSSSVPVSIRASGVIVASEIEANSDIRIKRNINTSASQNDLATLLKIRVTDYQLKDSVYFGNGKIKGFIAQELEKVLPQAVHTNADYVPDIYCLSTSTEYNEKDKTLKVSSCKPHQLKVGDKVKAFAGDGMQEQYVSAINNETTFTLSNWEIKQAGMNPVEKVFVWGKWVTDFHTVDYNQVFSLGISAIQQLAKENDELKTKTASLQQQIDELKEIIMKKSK